MKIIGVAYNINELHNIKDYIDCVLIEHEFLSNPFYSKIDAMSLILEAKKLNIIPILKVNRMVHPLEIDKVKNYILEYSKTDVYFYITDLGVFNILKNMELLDKTIYNPNTMICNSLDALEYLSYGLDSIGLSLEITSKDVQLINSKCDNKVFYQVFGYHLMFHSKRNLISLYGQKIGKEIDKNDMYLEESTRSDLYPIVENEQGTLIYRSYLISLIKEIKNLNLKYAYFEHFKIDDLTYLKVLQIYNDYINDKIDINLALQLIEILNLNIKDGFTYKDSVYQKEEF